MATPQLNTQNSNQLDYTNKLIKIAVLGGIRLDGLDRMRVTVKIQGTEVDSLAVRHNLDLYNDTQVEKLIRKTATKLEIGTSVIEASINELIEALEKYRLEQLESTDQKPQTKQLTEKEKSEALQLLQENELLKKTNELIGQSGIIGEETNRLIMYLIFSSRKREQPLHIISLGSSGTGKTHLQESIGNLIPEEEKIEITTLSENAFYYFGQQELKNKLILIEDLDGAEGALYPIRELQSKKKISKTIAFKNTKGETKTTNITVEGPVCVAGCTTKESIYEDNANRSFLIYIDESQEQDQRIMEYQRKSSAGKLDITEQLKAKALLQNSQYLLKSIKVINPYAEILELPKEVLKPRRTNAHYLQFIELITYYYQHQREIKHDEETGEEYIETTIEDIQNANELLKEVLLRKSDVVNGATRNYLEKLKSYLNSKSKTEFTNAEIRKNLKVKETTLRRYHNDLQDESLIVKIHDKESRSYVFRLTDEKEYETLKNQITNILQECLTKAQTATTPPNRQIQNGEHKILNNNELKDIATETTTKGKRTKKEIKEV
jgi:hypothetical protein